MTQHHPIVPPPEAMERLCTQAGKTWQDRIELAYQAGADAELEACCEWIESELRGQLRPAWRIAKQLRAARRPKPLSDKQQALEQLDGIRTVFRMSHGGELVCDRILHALEQLPDDQ